MSRGFRLWNRQDRKVVKENKYLQRIETVKLSGLWSSLRKLSLRIAVMYFLWWLFICSSGQTRHSRNLDFYIKCDHGDQHDSPPKNNRDLNQSHRQTDTDHWGDNTILRPSYLQMGFCILVRHFYLLNQGLGPIFYDLHSPQPGINSPITLTFDSTWPRCP